MKTVYAETSLYSSYGDFRLEIKLDIGRELTDIDSSNIYRFVSELKKELFKESNKTNPKVLAKIEQNKEELLGLFGNAKIFAEEIPNEYDSEYYLNWFKVTTEKGIFKVGWRKRVIVVDWESIPSLPIANVLFREEDVTKHERLIHAWGTDKAKEYITKLLNFPQC